MPLDPERLAADVVQVVKAATDSLKARLATLETKVAAMPADATSEDDLVAHFTGLLTKELADFAPPATLTRKRITKTANGDFLIADEPA
jgi:hypothetical protein